MYPKLTFTLLDMMENILQNFTSAYLFSLSVTKVRKKLHYTKLIKLIRYNEV